MSDIRISLIQTSLHWENPTANLKMFDQKINAVEETDLIVLPEMFSTGFSMQPEHLAETMDGQAVQHMRQWAAQKQAAVCGSLIIKEGTHYFNRFLWVQANGTIYQYDKAHLFGLGDEQNHYSRGHQTLTISYKGFNLRCVICYDLRFPVWLRNKKDYDILIVVANWPERRIYAWKHLLIARAIENQCFVAAVNRVGNDGSNIYHNGCSMFLGPKGEIIQERNDDECVLQTMFSMKELDQVRRDLPFLGDADSFNVLR